MKIESTRSAEGPIRDKMCVLVLNYSHFFVHAFINTAKKRPFKRPLGQVNLSVQRNQLLLHTRSQRIPANKKKRRREKKREKEKTQHTLAQKRDKPCVFARTALATNDQTKSRLSGSHVRGQHTYQQTQSQQRDRGAVLHRRRKKTP